MDMKRFIVNSLLSLLLLAGLSLNTAQAAEKTEQQAGQPVATNPLSLVPAKPKLDAKGFVLMDADSGKILAADNPNQRMAPASLTKMMTLYIASQAIKNGQIHLDDKVTVSHDAWSRQGSKMFLKQGQQVTVHELIQGIIVDSGNDACVALAEFIAGNEDTFANIMNQEAQRLGMKNSHFTDSTGLPHPDHYTTPQDMAILARALINDFPEDYAWYKQKWFEFNGIRQPNRNRLLWRYKYADGLKTGHTKEAGFCLVSSAKKDGVRLISVVMGAPTDAKRASDSQALLTYGFRFFDTYKLYGKEQAVTKPRVYGGEHKTVEVGLTKDLYLTIPRGQYKNLKAITKLNSPIKAPIKKGQQLGTLSVQLKGTEIANEPLVALQDDAEGSWWTRMKDSVSLSFSDSDDDKDQTKNS